MNVFRYNASALTHVGAVRSQNEDAMLLRPDVGLWAVADGMGGLQHGQWASQEVVAPLSAVLLDGGEVADAERIGDTITNANMKIFTEAEKAGIQMGTT